MSKENRVSDKRLSQMIEDANLQYLAAGFPDLCALWQDRIDAFTELQSLRSTLSLPAQEPVPAEYDPDAPPDHSADNAADFILNELAKTLKVDFRPAEGSETWEGDVLGTMWHALTDSGVIDEWDNSLRVSPKSASPQPGVVITEEMVERVWLAVLDCPHTITGQEIILRHAVDKEGRNATNQLRERITAALKEA